MGIIVKGQEKKPAQPPQPKPSEAKPKVSSTPSRPLRQEFAETLATAW